MSAAEPRPGLMHSLTRRALLLGGLSLPLLALTGCREKTVWNQKMTVTVNTPQGPVSGSSVVQVTSFFGLQPMTGNDVAYGIDGEAVVVEVAPGQYFFATFGAQLFSVAERYYRSAPERFTSQTRGLWLAEMPMQAGAGAVLVAAPLLVMFRDINDPRSVAIVNPRTLNGAFGEGYSVASVTLEVTTEPVSQAKIDRILPWLSTEKNSLLSGEPFSTADPLSQITARYFKLGQS